MSTVSFSASSTPAAAAEEALRRILDGRRTGRQFGAPPRPRAAAFEDATGALVRQAPKVLALVAVAIALTAATSSVMTRGQSRHGLTGTVRFGDAPLANGILEFHLKNQSADAKAFSTVIHTDAEGAFHRGPVGGLPRGTYAVVVKSRPPAAGAARRPRAVVIPPQYVASTSTPLSVEVNGSRAPLELVIR
jgi:hypothetical protein